MGNLRYDAEFCHLEVKWVRLWSIHPQYLDRAGLTALWREGLLAQKVLQGMTRGDRNHPKLVRFRSAADPVAAIGYYLTEGAKEAERRSYRDDPGKIRKDSYNGKNAGTQGQIN